jgi:hypothetical protein
VPLALPPHPPPPPHPTPTPTLTQTLTGRLLWAFSGINEHEVNEGYLPYLTALRRKLAFVRERDGQRMPAIEQLAPEVERLRLRATDKVRECLLELIRAMKKPRQNLAQYQTATLLKYKALNAFLLEQHPSAAADVHNNYLAIMREFYGKQFARYAAQLGRVAVRAPGAVDGPKVEGGRPGMGRVRLT